MAKGDYYFPLYYKRLLASTVGWKDDEFGCYLKLLIYQFDNGSIPADLDDLSRIAPSVKRHWPKLLSKKFKEDTKGGLVNEVMQEIYDEVQALKERNSKNGRKGGRPKNNPNETDRFILGKPDETQTKAIPVTNNQQPKENTGPPANLENSNLFRKPVIPTKIQVWEAIQAAGGTKEMAKSFYEKHEATGWFINGSPVVNYQVLAQRFVANWKQNDKKDGQEVPPGPNYKKI